MTTDRLTFASTITAEGRRIKGSVQLAGTRTFRNGEYVQVDPAALIKASTKGIFASWEHDDGKLLAADSNGTLTVTRHEQGFDYETSELPDTTYANDALELVRGGYVTGSSFEIEGLRSDFTTDPDGTRVRTYTGIKHFRSVSPVRDPAFPSTSAAFAKENPVTDILDEPETPAPAPEAPKFTAAPDAESETFAAQAKRMELAELESWLDNLAAGPLTPARQAMYKAFAAEYDSRKAVDAEARDRAERISLAHDIRRGKGPKAPATNELFSSDDYNAAFAQYLRDGRPSHMEQFAQSIAGDGTQGGFTVPDGFLAKVTTRLKAFGGIAGIAEEITTSSGESLRWPYLDDTSNTGAIATEGSAPASGGADLVFDSVELGAFSYAATGTGNAPLKVSLELIQDSAFDITGLVSNALGERIGRKQALHLATGIGGSEPVGLLSKTLDTMTATAVSLAGPEHIFQVDSEYRNGGNARWVMSDTTLAKLWTAQATSNEPLFQPGRTLDGKPFDVFFGYPITIDPAAGNLVAFGDIRRGYIIRRVRGVQVLVDPYTAQSTRQVAYYAWARMDATIQDANAYSVSTWASVAADT